MMFASRAMTTTTEPACRAAPTDPSARERTGGRSGARRATGRGEHAGRSGAERRGGHIDLPVPLVDDVGRQASTTGITPTSVTVGNVSIISGPVPGLFEGAPTGVKAYFAYINSQGGVNGRKLNVQSFDTGFSGEQNGSETQQAESSDFAMVGNFSLFDTYGCPTLAENPAFPDVSVTLDPGTNALPNDYSAQPLAVGAGLGGFKSSAPSTPRHSRSARSSRQPRRPSPSGRVRRQPSSTWASRSPTRRRWDR